jgi:hypothetical protein
MQASRVLVVDGDRSARDALVTGLRSVGSILKLLTKSGA